MKELLKSDSICESYAQVKKGPVFLTQSVLSDTKHRAASLIQQRGDDVALFTVWKPLPLEVQVEALRDVVLFVC